MGGIRRKPNCRYSRNCLSAIASPFSISWTRRACPLWQRARGHRWRCGLASVRCSRSSRRTGAVILCAWRSSWANWQPGFIRRAGATGIGRSCATYSLRRGIMACSSTAGSRYGSRGRCARYPPNTHRPWTIWSSLTWLFHQGAPRGRLSTWQHWISSGLSPPRDTALTWRHIP